jgi:hypothetical protein
VTEEPTAPPDLKRRRIAIQRLLACEEDAHHSYYENLKRSATRLSGKLVGDRTAATLVAVAIEELVRSDSTYRALVNEYE